MKKVISFSLWGDDPKYTMGAIANAELALKLYPEWECRFFVHAAVRKHIVDSLKSYPNTVVTLRGESPDWRGMFWRFETVAYPEYSVSIFRDTDSRLSNREVAAVNEWLASDKTFHIMRDHPHHGYPILGGMWGFKHTDKYPIKDLMDGFDKQNSYGTDYKFFIDKLYPLIGEDKVVHDPFFDKKPFPVQRIGTEFVGDVFDCNNQRHPDYHRFINGH